MYIAFLDEFGHIGPYVSRSHAAHNQSPVFGLAGFIIPHQHAREIATSFYQSKARLFAKEIEHSRGHAATWEKKGKDIFTTNNIDRFPNLKREMYRSLNRIARLGGRIFYYGRVKYQAAQDSNSAGLYKTVMSHSIRQLDSFCETSRSNFIIILDEHSDRKKLLEAAAKTMFGDSPARALIEPPLQVESHLYQTIQLADWIATLVGRVTAYREARDAFADWEWADRLFGTRLDSSATHSKLWRPSASQRRIHFPPTPTK